MAKYEAQNLEYNMDLEWSDLDRALQDIIGTLGIADREVKQFGKDFESALDSVLNEVRPVVHMINTLGQSFDTSMKIAKKQIRPVISELKEIGKAAGEAVQGVVGVANEVNGMANKAAAGLKKVDKFLGNIQTVGGAVMDSLKQGANETSAAFERQETAVKGVNQAFSGMKGGSRTLSSYAKAASKASVEIERLEEQTKDLNLAQDKQEEILDRLTNARRTANVMLRESTRAQQTNATSVRSSSGELKGVLADVRNVGLGTFTALSIGVAASAKPLFELDDQMAVFRATAAATDEDVSNLVETAKGLEGIKTTAAAAAAVELSRAGVKAKDATKSLGTFNNAAIATGESMDRVSSIILSTNRAFDQGFGRIGDTSDILVKVANESSTSISEIGVGMGYLASTAKGANQTLEDTGALFAVLSNSGLTASMAANSLQNSFFRLAAPADEAKEIISKLHLELDNGEGKLKRMPEIIEDLRTKMAGLSDIKKMELLKKIFGEVGANSILTLMNKSREEIDAMVKSIHNYQGETERTAEIMKQSLGFQFKELQKDIELVRLELAEAMLPQLKDLMEFVKGVAKGFNELSDESKKQIGLLITLGGLVSGGAALFGTLALSIWGTVTASKALFGAYKSHIAKSVAVEGANTATAGSFVAVDASAKGAAISMGAFLGAIGVIVAGGALIIKALNDWNVALKNADEAWDKFYTTIDDKAGKLSEALRKTMDELNSVQTFDAATDAAFKSMELKNEIDGIERTWERINELEKKFNSRDTYEVDYRLIQEAKEYRNELKEIGIETEADFIRIVGQKNRRLEELKAQRDKYTQATQDKREKEEKPKPDPNPNKDFNTEEKSQVDAVLARYEAKKKELSIDEKRLDTERARTEELDAQSKILIRTSELNGKNIVTPVVAGPGVKEGGYSGDSGLDILAPEGAPVVAALSGKIVYSERGHTKWNKGKDTPNSVLMELDEPFEYAGKMIRYAWYTHLKELEHDIKSGSGKQMRIEAGQKIGSVGYGNQVSHLHFGLLSDRSQRAGTYLKDNQVRGALSLKAGQSIVGNQSSTITSSKFDSREYQDEVAALKNNLQAARDAQSELNKLLSSGSLTDKEREKAQTKVLELRVEEQNIIGQVAKLDADYAKDRSKKIKEINSDILRMYAENEQARISAMGDELDRFDAQHKYELAILAQNEQAKLASFDGTESQRIQLTAEFNEKRSLLNEKYDKDRVLVIEARNQRIQDLDWQLEAGRIAAIEGTVEAAGRAVDLELEKRLDAYEDEQTKLKLLGKEGAEEWKRIEGLKTQATEAAAKKRTQAVLNADNALIKSQQSLIQTQMTESARDFQKTFEDMISGKQKTGLMSRDKNDLNLTKTSDVFGSDDMTELAKSLGTEDLDKALKGIGQQYAKQTKLVANLKEEQKSLTANTTEYNNKQKEVTEEEQKQYRLGLMMGILQNEGFSNMVFQYQNVILPLLDQANEKHERMIGIIDAASQAASGLAEVFGETGRNIAAGISVGANAIKGGMNFHKVASDMRAKLPMPQQMDIGMVLADPTGMTAAIQAGIAMLPMVVDHWKKTVDIVSGLWGESSIDKSFKKLTDDNADYQLKKELEVQRKQMEIRKQSGENVLQEELSLLDQESNLKIKELNKQLADTKNFWDGNGTGLFGLYSVEDIVAAQKQGFDIQDKIDQENKGREETKEETRKNDAKNRIERERLTEDLIQQNRAQIIEAGQNKIEMIEQEGQKRSLEARRHYEDELIRLAEAGLLTDDVILQLAENLKNTELQIDKETRQQKMSAASSQRKQELDNWYNHRETLLNQEKDGAQKSLKLLELKKKRTLETLDAEMGQYEEGTTEWINLSQQRATAEIDFNNQIAKSNEDLAKKRTESLEDYRAQLAVLKAELTDNPLDDTVSGSRLSLIGINREEATAREQAIADYGDDQEILGAIQQFYAQKRGNWYKDNEKKILEDVKQQYIDAEKDKLEAQLKPLQKIVDQEEERIRKLEHQNAEYERQLQLIDERYNKEKAAFDERDRAEFDQKLSEINIQPEMERGANYLANEEIINGTVLDRSSRETQLRGLRELLDQEEKRIAAKLRLEDVTKSQYLEEMSLITLRRARAIQEAQLDAKNDKEDTDLLDEFSKEYEKYQNLQGEAIEERRTEERKAKEELVNSNNTLIESSRYTIQEQQFQMDGLRATYDSNLKAMEGSMDGWMEKLQQLAPAIAKQARDAISSIQEIRDELSQPFNIVVQSTSAGGYDTPFYTDDGGDIPVSQIPRKSERTLDDPAGAFVVEGNDGYWYRTDDEMIRKIRGYQTGGVIPDESIYENDGAIIRVSAGERILQRDFNRRMENMLQHFEVLPLGGRGMGGGDVIVNIGNISKDVDIKKIENVLDRHARKNKSNGVKRWGINSISRN